MKRRSRIDQARESLRLQQIYNVFLSYAMNVVLDRGLLGDFRRFMQEWIYDPPQPVVPLSTPVKTRLLLQELGPTYVKMGQIVSSRSEVLPREWQDELNKLQSNVAPFPSDQVREIIEEEFSAEPEDLYETFDPNPLAAASMAQVHRATLHSGEDVIVKVQRPHIQHQVKADLGIMSSAAYVLERRVEWAREIDLVGILDEFGTNLLYELDYGGEAYNARRLARNMESIEGVHIPIVYTELSTSRVLTQEFINGVKITNLEAITAAGLERRPIAEATLRSLVKQLLIDGFFHGDLHPGNVLVKLDTGQVNYIDLGMVGEVTVNQRISLINLLMTIRQGDTRGLAQTMLSLSVPFKEVDTKAYYRDFERQISRYMEPGSGASVGESVGLAFDILQTHGLRLNAELTLAIKALTQVDAIISALLPDDSMVQMADAMVRDLALEQVTADNVSNLLRQQATLTLREAINRAPTLQEATLKWLDQYEKGRFTIEMDTSELNRTLEKTRRTATLGIVGLLLVGMIIGSAIASSIALTGDFFGFLPNLAFLGYGVAMILAGVLVIGMLWRMWRGGDL